MSVSDQYLELDTDSFRSAEVREQGSLRTDDSSIHDASDSGSVPCRGCAVDLVCTRVRGTGCNNCHFGFR